LSRTGAGGATSSAHRPPAVSAFTQEADAAAAGAALAADASFEAEADGSARSGSGRGAAAEATGASAAAAGRGDVAAQGSRDLYRGLLPSISPVRRQGRSEEPEGFPGS
jgi:hypothetical protein